MRRVGVSLVVFVLVLVVGAGLRALLGRPFEPPPNIEFEAKARATAAAGVVPESPDLDTDLDAGDDARPAAAPVTGGPGVVDEQANRRTWPEPPEVMESLILQEIYRLNDSRIDPITAVECTATRCAIRVITGAASDALAYGDSDFATWISGPPYEASPPRVTLTLFPRNEWTVHWTSYGETRESVFLRTGATVDMLRRRAGSYFDNNDSPEAAPQVIGRNEAGAEIIAENVCSYDCPSDTRGVIHVRVAAGRTCRELNGTEETIMVRTSFGGLQERSFCLPNLLADD